MIWCNGDCMVDSTNTQNDLGHDQNFKENVRRQLEERERAVMLRKAGLEGPWMDMDPMAIGALRWTGGIVGAFLLVFGGIWMLAILGYTVPWYSVFPIVAIISGAAFLIAAIVTRRSRRLR